MMGPEGSMRRPARSIACVAALAAFSLLGCAARQPVAVQYDLQEDFGRYRTWDWIDGHAVVVRAPSHDAQQIEARLTEMLAFELSKRGLARSPGNAEVRVAALLVARRSVTSTRRATAMQTLPSFHDQGNFEIQGDVTDLRALDRVRLAVFVTSPRQEKVLWQGELNDQFLDGFAPHLGDALESLLANFPPRETVTD
jgi:uncharacterized protein DUF4136